MGDSRINLCWDLSTFENFMEEGAFAKWSKNFISHIIFKFMVRERYYGVWGKIHKGPILIIGVCFCYLLKLFETSLIRHTVDPS